MLFNLKKIFQNKRAFIWYLFEMEAKWAVIGLLFGLVVGILMVADIIPVSGILGLCPAATK